MEWYAPFPAADLTQRLPLGDVRALVQRGWWLTLADYHAQLDEAAQEYVRGYLRQHMRTTEVARRWCEERQLPLELVPGYALLTPGAGVMVEPPAAMKLLVSGRKKKLPDRNAWPTQPEASPGRWLDLYELPVPHLWRAGEAWTDGGDAHIARFGRTRVYLLEEEEDAPA